MQQMNRVEVGESGKVSLGVNHTEFLSEELDKAAFHCNGSAEHVDESKIIRTTYGLFYKGKTRSNELMRIDVQYSGRRLVHLKYSEKPYDIKASIIISLNDEGYTANVLFLDSSVPLDKQGKWTNKILRDFLRFFNYKIEDYNGKLTNESTSIRRPALGIGLIRLKDGVKGKYYKNLAYLRDNKGITKEMFDLCFAQNIGGRRCEINSRSVG